MPSSPNRQNISRRAVIAGAPLVQVTAFAATTPTTPPTFTPDQMKLIEAIVDRFIPADDLGPGAREAGVPVYLERSFAGYLSADKTLFSESLAAIDAASRIRFKGDFVQLSPDRQDELLTAMEKNRRCHRTVLRSMQVRGYLRD